MRLSLFCTRLYIFTVIFLIANVRGNEPSIAEYYATLEVSDLQLNGDTIDNVLKKLTETIQRDSRGAQIGIVLVTPSEALLRKSITKSFHKRVLKDILEELCTIADLHYALDHHAILVGGKSVDLSKKGLRVEPSRGEELGEVGKLITLSKFMFSGTAVTSVVDVIQKQSVQFNTTGEPIIIQSKLHFAASEPKVFIWFPIIVTGEAVEYVCLSSGLRFSSPSNGVYIVLNR